MVKNNTGGNKGKKGARKNMGGAGGGGGGGDVRRVKDPNEMYAVVTKIYSGRKCDVIGTDGKTYSCNVRGKFLKGRRGGDASITIGAWLMVGFYDWEVRADGSKNCDLLEIYTFIEKDKLRQLEGRNLAAIMHVGDMAGTENDCTFSNFRVDEAEEEDEEDSASSSNEDEDADLKEQKVPKVSTVVPLPKVVPQKKESPQEQMDWLKINIEDI
jgi:hypothetical protein